ncbi:hypothetical protein [Aquimarina muelleri]|uniref:Uncharacterized protein n=1 Tax=Aquimarina muelleri TaxID=279356 RepID=A0A918JWI7_9FLAO|nr:hypothetical protein [Aquimarina muelleri]MCX2761820.1 hypothetical protein [Aquimarina muelleri]GGX23474.1 hypothetical protein GCM10007384_25850 [Aquimarina muelleri]
MFEKIKHKILLFLVALSISTISSSQTSNKKFNCLSIDTMGLLKKSFDSFEKDLFNHYEFNNDSIKTYRTFLTELYSLSINLRKLPSDTSIELARMFKKKAKDKSSLWVLLSTYDDQMEASKETSTPKTDTKNEEEIMTFNYRGGFIQCLKNNSSSNSFKDIINTLEYDGNVSPSLIAQRLHDLPTKELNSPEVKNFIAFDIYYSILLIIEKAFK